MADPRIERLARVLVDYSVAVKPRQQVVITGDTLAAPLLEAVYECVLERGAFPQTVVNLPGLNAAFFRRANDEQLDYISPQARFAYETADVLISAAAAANTRELNAVDPARQARRRRAMTPLVERYMERTANGELKWVGTVFPASGHAQDAEMSTREFEDFYYHACHVAGDDDPVAHWRQVHAEQQRLVEWLRPHDRVEIRGSNVDLTLSIKDRVFLNADGTHNMPDGEVFTSPVEDSASGWVRFTYPVVAYGREMEGVELKFENGKAVAATAKKNEAFLLSALDTDAGARFLGEFAIGTNYGIQRFTRSILFDEKIGGSFHLALGLGFAEAGGRNTSGLHWDMICDMRDGGEMRADGELFYQNGKFVI